MKKQRRKKSHTGLIVLFSLLAVFSGLVGAMFLIKTETVTVTGNIYVSDELILAQVFPDEGHKTLFHVLIRRFFKKPAIPGMSSVTVVPKALKHCEIRVKEKEPVCQIFDGTCYNILTADGLVLFRQAEPADSIPIINNVPVKSADVLSLISVADEESLKTILIYASRFLEEKIPLETLTVDKDGIRARIGKVTVILGNSFGAAEKVSEIRDMYPKWQELNLKGILHMEDFTLEKGTAGSYFEVIPE